MTSLFDDISQFDDGFAAARREAAAVAHKRVQDTVGPYLRLSKTAEEYDARLSYVSDDIRRIVADTAGEFSVDQDKLLDAIAENLKGDGVTDLNMDLLDAPSAVGTGPKEAGGHKDGCTCGFCKNKGNIGKPKDEEHDKENHDDDDGSTSSSGESSDEGSDDDSGSPFEASTHVADAPRDGGGATKTVKLPKGDGKSIGDGASPKIDKKTWKPNALDGSGNLPAVPEGIEMSGSPVPTERQDLVDEKRDYDADFEDKIDAATTTQDLPSAGDNANTTERNISQEGQMGQWTEAQGDAVTPQVFAATADNPLKAILDAGFVAPNQVESAIDSFDSKE